MKTPQIAKRTANGTYKNGSTRYEYIFNFDFTSREQYLEWVKDWKTRWHEYASSVKADKAEIAENKKNGLGSVANSIHSSIVRNRSQAHLLLAERQAGKVEAQRQYI